MPIAIHEAKILQAFLGALFLGALYVTFFFALRTLLTKNGEFKRTGDIQWLLLSVTIVMAINATLHVTVAVVQIFNSLNDFYNSPMGPDIAFLNISDWINVLQTFILNFQNSIGDAMLIYRCWVVWGHKLVVVSFPLLLWAANTAVGIYIVYVNATLNTQELVTTTRLSEPIKAWWAITIPLNVITTALIIYRLYSVDSQNRQFGVVSTANGKGRRSPLRYVMKIIIESGALYTTSAVITFILVIISNPALYTMATVTVDIIGIAFNSITVRAGKGSKPSNNFNTSQSSGAGSQNHTASHSVPLRMLASQHRPSDMEAGKGNAVLISRDVVKDYGYGQ